MLFTLTDPMHEPQISVTGLGLVHGRSLGWWALNGFTGSVIGHDGISVGLEFECIYVHAVALPAEEVLKSFGSFTCS